MTREDHIRRSPIRFEDPNYQICYDYWQSLRGDRKSPRWREWDWLQIPSRLIPFFLVVDVHYEPMDFIYRFWGTASVTMHDIDFTNQSISKIRSPLTAEQTRRQYMDVVEAHVAIGTEYTIKAGENGPPHIQISLRMPFSEDGERVTQIATYVDWSQDLDRIRQEHIREFGPRTPKT